MREIEVALVRVPEHKRDNEAAIKEKFEQLIEISGGLSFVNPGDSVLIKVSVNSKKPYPITTDPKMVAMLINLLIFRRPSAIFVGGNSVCSRKTKKNFKLIGLDKIIGDAVKNSPGMPIKLISFDNYIYRDRNITKDMQDDWGELSPGHCIFRMPKMLYEDDPYLKQQNLPARIDHIIVLDNIKTHCLAGISMGMGSYVDFMDRASHRLLFWLPRPGFRRPRPSKFLDKEAIQKRIAEIFAYSPLPRLVILDGREPILKGGADSNNPVWRLPSFGKNPYLGVMLAGSDIVAVDAAGTALIKTQKKISRWITKYSIWEMPTFKRMSELGIGATQADKIYLHADSPEDIFKEMAWFLQ